MLRRASNLLDLLEASEGWGPPRVRSDTGNHATMRARANARRSQHDTPRESLGGPPGWVVTVTWRASTSASLVLARGWHATPIKRPRSASKTKTTPALLATATRRPSAEKTHERSRQEKPPPIRPRSSCRHERAPPCAARGACAAASPLRCSAPLSPSPPSEIECSDARSAVAAIASARAASLWRGSRIPISSTLARHASGPSIASRGPRAPPARAPRAAAFGALGAWDAAAGEAPSPPSPPSRSEAPPPSRITPRHLP